MLEVCMNPLLPLSWSLFLLSWYFCNVLTSSFIFSSLLPHLLTQNISIFSICFTSPARSFRSPGWQKAVIWSACDWQLYALSRDEYCQTTAHFCNCNEGLQERWLFFCSVSCHRLKAKYIYTYICMYCTFLFTPSPIILISPPRLHRRGSRQVKMKSHRVDITFACIWYESICLGFC